MKYPKYIDYEKMYKRFFHKGINYLIDIANVNPDDVASIMKSKNKLYKNKLRNSISDLKKNYPNIRYISKPKGGLFYLVKFDTPIDNTTFESGNNYYLSTNHDNESRVNICG